MCTHVVQPRPLSIGHCGQARICSLARDHNESCDSLAIYIPIHRFLKKKTWLAGNDDGNFFNRWFFEAWERLSSFSYSSQSAAFGAFFKNGFLGFRGSVAVLCFCTSNADFCMIKVGNSVRITGLV